jgi:hypothetical protein
MMIQKLPVFQPEKADSIRIFEATISNILIDVP